MLTVPDYQILYTDFWSDGFLFAYQNAHHEITYSIITYSMKFSGLIDNQKNLIYFFYFDDITSGFEKSQFFSI